jgi:hypothetical protein
MKWMFFVVLMLSSFCHLIGQQQYFVFIQETSHQPFYVRMADKSQSSTASGYLILPKLQDSSYTLYIGFPQNRGEEQFSISINHHDRGFELTKGGGEWKLIDLISKETVSPVAAGSKDATNGEVKKTDTYSELMAGVVDDSAVLYGKAVVADSTKPLDSLIKAETIIAKDTVVVAPKAVANAGKKKGAGKQKSKAEVVPQQKDLIQRAVDSVAAPVVKPVETQAAVPNIIRYSTENIEEGKLIIYIDRTCGAADTVRLIIPRTP